MKFNLRSINKTFIGHRPPQLDRSRNHFHFQRRKVLILDQAGGPSGCLPGDHALFAHRNRNAALNEIQSSCTADEPSANNDDVNLRREFIVGGYLGRETPGTIAPPESLNMMG